MDTAPAHDTSDTATPAGHDGPTTGPVGPAPTTDDVVPAVPWLPGAAAAAVVAAAVAWFSAEMVRLTPGHLSYAVDDSHIHLRLAEQIAHGTYGVNPGEVASPASSPLWPLLLAPFGRFSWLDWMPLVLNGVAAVATTVLVYVVLCRGWRAAGRTAWLAAAGAAVLMVASGALALVFEGMEHSLQVTLTIAIVAGLLELARDPDRRGPWWLWASMVVLPWVRYEGLLTLAVAVVVAVALGATRRALRAAAVGVGGLVAFSLFLVVVLDLPPVPSSVLAKGKPSDMTLVEYLLDNLGQTAGASGNGLVPFLCLVLGLVLTAAVVVVRGRRSLRDPVVLLTAGATALLAAQVILAQPHRRYVGHAVLLTLVVAIALVVPLLWRRAPRAVAVGAVVLIAGVVAWGGDNYRGVLQGAPARAAGIYHQQYQMHRLAAEVLREPVAVNDLGQVAYANPYRVVDLWGLGDNDARRLRRSDSPGWASTIVEDRDVSIAMVYTSWLGEDLPEDWILVGRLHDPEFQGGPAEDTVDLYATDRAAAGRLRDALERFEPSDPDRTVVELVDG